MLKDFKPVGSEGEGDAIMGALDFDAVEFVDVAKVSSIKQGGKCCFVGCEKGVVVAGDKDIISGDEEDTEFSLVPFDEDAGVRFQLREPLFEDGRMEKLLPLTCEFLVTVEGAVDFPYHRSSVGVVAAHQGWKSHIDRLR